MANEEKRVYYTFDFNNDEIYKFEADVEDCYVPEIKPSKKSDKINKLNKDFFVKKKAILIAGAIALCLVIFAIILITRREVDNSNRIKFNEDCFTVAFSGFDTVGTARLKVDYYEVEWISKEIFREIEKGNEDDTVTVSDMYIKFKRAMTVSLDKSDNLSNGDIVTVTFDVNEEVLEELGVKLGKKEFKVKVEGLNEPAEVNLFEHLMVCLDGEGKDAFKVELIFPKGRYGVDANVFECSKDMVFTGENFTVAISEEGQRELKRNGVNVTVTERVYSVDELYSCYAKTIEDVESFDSLVLDGQKNIENYYSNMPEVIANVDYYGAWLSTFENYKVINELSIIYEVEVTPVNEEFETKKVYAQVIFSDIFDTLTMTGGAVYNGEYNKINDVAITTIEGEVFYYLLGKEDYTYYFDAIEYLGGGYSVDFDAEGAINSWK